MKFSKEGRRRKIRYRIRRKVNGTSACPRLSVYRSNKYIHCQLVDDISGHTLAYATSKEEGVPTGVPKIEQAKAVGKILAEKARSKNIETIVFDRSGYLYHGRVKALADAAREGGLKF
jgi:large subunit ribosomal protein L18